MTVLINYITNRILLAQALLKFVSYDMKSAELCPQNVCADIIQQLLIKRSNKETCTDDMGIRHLSEK